MSFLSTVRVRRALRLASLGAMCVSLTAEVAHAQGVKSGDQVDLGDIVVTAQRREQKLDKVGISVTALSGDQLAKLGITNSTSLTQQVPGIVFNSISSGSDHATLAVRGVAQTDYSLNQESPNAVYVDDVYQTSNAEINLDFYDLKRVEVLRGPQGTLFGRNSTGGLVNVITSDPSPDYNGYLSLDVGRFGKTRIEGAVGGAIAEGVSFRLAGLFNHDDGFWHNYTGHDTLQNKSYALRGKLRAELSPNLVANLSLTYERTPSARVGTYKVENTYIDPANGQPAILPANVDAYGTGPGNNALGFRDPYGLKPASAFADFGRLDKEKISPTLRLDFKVSDAISITSISNYTHFKYYYSEDDGDVFSASGQPQNALFFDSSQRLTQFSQELRIDGNYDKLHWVAGAYYLHTKQNDDQAYIFPFFSGTSSAFHDTNPVYQKVNSYSAFAQMEYSFTPQFKFTLGGRVTQDNKDFSSQVYFLESGKTVFNPPFLYYNFDTSNPAVGNIARSRHTDWSGKAQIDFTPNDDSLYYASVSRGIRGPGFNTNLNANITLAQTPFKAEHLYAYELGTKLKLLDRLLRFNASAFYYDYHDAQSQQFLGLAALVQNLDGHMYGGEAEFSSSPMRGLDLSLGVAYLETKLKGVQTAFSGTRDQQSAYAPRWSVNGLARKSFDVGDSALSVQWDFSYQDKQYSSIDNTAVNLLASSFIHNASVTYNWKPHALSITGYVTNIGNISKQIHSYDVTTLFGYRSLSLGRPREWGVRVRQEF